jgi:hypothetical protein
MRALIDTFETSIEAMLPRLSSDNLNVAIDLAALPERRVNTLRMFPGRPGPPVWGVRALSSDPKWRDHRLCTHQARGICHHQNRALGGALRL